MGCGGSKVAEETQLVSLCRQRRHLILSAVDNRYSFAAAQSAYILSLATFGDILLRFVSEGFVPGPPASPVLKLPVDQKKEEGSLPTSVSHSLSHRSLSGSRLNFTSDHSKAESPIHSPMKPADGSPASESPAVMNYMKSTAIPSMVFAENMPIPQPEMVMWTEPVWSFAEPRANPAIQSPPARDQLPPLPPTADAWDFLNPFTSVESMYSFYYGDLDASADSSELRLRERIPDLEDESQVENVKQVVIEQKSETVVNKNADIGNGSVGGHIFLDEDDEEDDENDGISAEKDNDCPVSDELRSKVTTASAAPHKKGVSFSGEVVLEEDGKSGKVEDFTALVTQGTRDIVEVVGEIKGHFVKASQSGSEVSVLLEVGKLPYRPKTKTQQFFEVLRKPPRSMTDMSDDFKMKPDNLSAVLEEICTWEGKLFEEVKNEEKVRLGYEKYFKRLKDLDMKGAEPDKFHAAQASIRKQLTKINMSIRAINTVSDNAHRLRDDELRHQFPKLIEGMLHQEVLSSRAQPGKNLLLFSHENSILHFQSGTDNSASVALVSSLHVKETTLSRKRASFPHRRLGKGSPSRDFRVHIDEARMMRMWKAMMVCHQKQLQAISEGKILDIILRNVSREAAVKSVMHLEQGVIKWCSSFVNWMNAQTTFVGTLNVWLLKCIDQEPEVTADGVVPFSPSRVGAPPVVVLCSDWYQMTKNLPVDPVVETMHAFAENTHKLWELLDEEYHQSLKIKSLSKNLNKQHTLLQQEENKMQGTRGRSDKLAISLAKDDISMSHRKMILDKIRKELEEEKLKRVELVKKIQDGAFTTLKMGLVQIFDVMANFSSSIIKAYEGIRISYVGNA